MVVKTRELELLLAAGRLYLGNARDDEALACLDPKLEWPYLEKIASREGMSGILAAELERLRRSHGLNLPLEKLSGALRATFATNGALFAELLGLRSVLQKKGARALLLKGGALTTTAYGGQLGLRPLSDLDILVKESDLPGVREALLARGFLSTSTNGTLFTKRALIFDIHTDLVNASRIRRRELAFRFDPDVIWAKSVALDPAEPTFRVLSPAHQFLHLAVHGLKHSFSRMIWLLDLALVSRQLDWEELLLQAESTGTLRPVVYALSALGPMLRIKVPPGVWVSLPTPNRLERGFMNAVVERRASEPVGELAVAFSIPTLAGRLAYLFEFTFPRPAVLRSVFPDGSVRGFYLRRVGQILRLAASYTKSVLRWQAPVEVPKPAGTPPVVGT